MGEPRYLGPVIVGVDGSERSAEALALADLLGPALGRPVVIAHVHPFRQLSSLFAKGEYERLLREVAESTFEQIRAHLPKGRTYKVLGTDGYGRSDFRTKLREHFEVDRHYVVVAALKALAEEGSVPATKVAEAIAKYGIDTDKINPLDA